MTSSRHTSSSSYRRVISPPGGARRLLEQQPVQRARRLPQLQRARQPQQQRRFSAGAGVPHLGPPSTARDKTRCERAHRHRRRGWRFRHWPPTPVCGPRRRVEDGAGESRPHGWSFDRRCQRAEVAEKGAIGSRGNDPGHGCADADVNVHGTAGVRRRITTATVSARMPCRGCQRAEGVAEVARRATEATVLVTNAPTQMST
jgi:hypothetical protein